MKPIWFLDIDGVLNVVAPKPDPRATWTSLTIDVGDIADLQVMCRPQVLDFLNHVHEDGLAEVRWLTTWQLADDAQNELARRLGIPDFAATHIPPGLWHGGTTDHPFRGQFGTWWKAKALLRTINETGNTGRPIVWTDDDLPSKEARSFLKSVAPETPHLVVRPFENQGLTDEHLGRIGKFLAVHAEAGTPAL